MNSRFSFSNKTIFLISPERWGKMKVSKHHYALELANRECVVYFIEPPSLHNNAIEIQNCAENKNIKLVQYKPLFRGKRFLPSFIFSWLLRLQIQKIITAVGKTPDVVLCFHGYLFRNLKWFKPNIGSIFFAADQFYYGRYPTEVDSANIAVAVSDTILQEMSGSGTYKSLINHGLQKSFAGSAAERLEKGIDQKEVHQIVAGYVGNLMMECLDRVTMREVIMQNPEIRFIFWGSYESKDLNLGGIASDEANEFVLFLKAAPNVELRGVVTGDALQMQMQQAQLFWICWRLGKHKLWDGSNSHKVMEYLSTGSPIVSHFMSSYKTKPELMYMLPSNSNEKFPELFKSVVQKIIAGEETCVIKKRLQWAVENSYAKQLDRIESLLADQLDGTL
jgi:hypothetical protein